jgi:lysozyme
MNLGSKGLEILKHYEQGPRGGFAARPYDDGVGVMTIGWGHAILKGEHFEEIDEYEAEELLRQDVRRFEAAVNNLGVPITQDQFDALLCLAYNIGVGAFAGSSVARCVRIGDMPKAGAHFEDWVKGGSPLKTLLGLVRRRKVERRLFETGIVNFNV